MSISSELASDPAQIAGARILSGGDRATVWECEVRANAPFLPRMNQHTICMCSQSRSFPAMLSRPTWSLKAAAETWDLLIVPAGEMCPPQTTGDGMCWSVSLPPARLQLAHRIASTPGSSSRRSPRLRAAAGIDDPSLGLMVLAMHQAVRAPRPAQRRYVDSMADALSVYLVEQHCTVASTRPNQLEDDDLARLNAYVHSKFSERCRAEDAADILGLSPKSFVRMLKARTGQSFTGYCLQRRLERSFELLQSGQMNVTEAAMETCFVSLAHFSRVFNKHFGLPPSALKR